MKTIHVVTSNFVTYDEREETPIAAFTSNAAATAFSDILTSKIEAVCVTEKGYTLLPSEILSIDKHARIYKNYADGEIFRSFYEIYEIPLTE